MEEQQENLIDPTVEKLTYPVTKFEYFANKFLGGMVIGVGYFTITKVVPHILEKMFRKNGGPNQGPPTVN